MALAAAVWLGAPGSQFTAADPVITSTGNYFYMRTDLSIRGGASPLAFQRIYNSANKIYTALGPGWTHNFNIQLTLGFSPTDASSAKSVIIESPTAREVFNRQPDGSYVAAPGTRSKLVRNNDGTLTETREDQTIWAFGSVGRLEKITDPRGFESKLTYDNHVGMLASVSDPLGRGALEFEYEGCHPSYTLEKLCRVTDWTGRAYTYGYDERGRLSTVTDPDGHSTSYTYLGEYGLLHTIRDARGHVAMTLEYDDLNRVTSETDARGQLTGSRTTFEYARRVAETDRDQSQTTVMDYPPSSFAPEWSTLMTDRSDSLRRAMERTTQTAPDDDPLVVQPVFEADWRLANCARHGGVVPPPAGAVSPDPPDSPSPLAQLPDFSVLPRPAAALPTVAACQDLATDKSQPSAVLGEAAGLPWQVTLKAIPAALAHASSIQTDAVGRLSSFDEIRDDQVVGTWYLSYDKEDHITLVQQPNADVPSQPMVTSLQYDEVGNLTVISEPDDQLERFAYDERDALVQSDRSNGSHATYAYDEAGHLSHAEWVGADGQQAAADYLVDGLGRARRTVRYPSWPATTGAITTLFAYDETGNRSAYTTPAG